MMPPERQCRAWYNVEPTSENIAIVCRVTDAAAYLRGRIYGREIRPALSTGCPEKAWAKHHATYEWEARMTRALLARAAAAAPPARRCMSARARCSQHHGKRRPNQ